jgi:hypothetical protein
VEWHKFAQTIAITAVGIKMIMLTQQLLIKTLS